MGNPAPDPVVLRGHGADVQSVSFATIDGQPCVLSGDSNGDVVAWDVRTRRPRWRLPAHTPSSGALHVGIEPSSGHIMTQGRDGTLKCWGTAHGPHEPPRAPPRWTLNAGSYHYCKFTTSGGDASSPGAPALVAVAAEIQSGVDICEMKNSSIDDETSTSNAPPSRVATLIAAADATHADKTTTSTSSESPPAATEDRLGTVMALAFIPNEDEDPSTSSSMLAAAYEEGTVCVWRIDSSTPLWRARVHGEAATCLAVDAVGKGFVSGGADGRCVRHRIVIADASDENSSIKVSVIGTHGPFAPASVDAAGDVRALRGIAAVAIRDDRKIFAAGCWDGRVRVFEYGRKSAGRLVASLGYHADVVSAVAFAPVSAQLCWAGHGGWLASGSRDGTVAMWAVFPVKEKGDGGDGDAVE